MIKEEYILREGKDQKDFDIRLKNNQMRIIEHGVEDESFDCRICNFGGTGNINKAKYHAKKTGHTIDFYREHWIEITYYNKPPQPTPK